ncbi:transcriptional repressor [Candidatus Woesearchaeota archaeon]|nr:transcriptional repressor [Candidatus Woesearchaeota archaeon]
MPRKNRNTKQKELIKQELSSINSFFSAEDLFLRVKEIDESIGVATIYRFLNEAEKNKELISYICDRKKVYSRGKKSHCHFVCEETGKVIHFEIDNIDFLKDKIPGSINSFQLEVKGICDKCVK